MTDPVGNSDHHSNAGEPGNYVFVDLAQLDDIISQWTSVCDAIRTNGLHLHQAINRVIAPAGDDPSGRQADRYVESLGLAALHSKAMSEYATGVADRLTASRARYLAVEQDNLGGLRRAGGG